jgi:protein-arginine kinase activator protein McsA
MKKKSARKTPVRPKTTSIEDMNVQSLEKLLDEALQKEDYEKAAQIRDIISSKKSMES